ncbi:pyridoxal phosphate-dependent aminotransferase [Symbioplanes lichenis]|uniref:pyridoxal phosphate-dependent aminotransferase n=1 Tax=Symbioplanes lichenis TaxID=1629072 RepID=UPI00273A4B9C|nr:pyridoxal phosphate-dependent aminotransferase [Actinoplanes lichenis]
MNEVPRNRRLLEFGTTVFSSMSALARETGSIDLGQGLPDTGGPPLLLEAAAAAVRAGRGGQYPPDIGVPELRGAVARHRERHHGIRYDPEEEVLVTAGATEAIAAAMLGLLNAGDEVVMLEPYYDSYAACIALAGAKRVPVTMRPPDFRLDVPALRRAVTPRTRLLLINSPHNPTGAVLSRAELGEIAAIAREHDLVVVTDEVYEHLLHDDAEHVPLATLPGMRERTVSICSAGKTFSVTGWRIGWVFAEPGLLGAVRAAKQFLTFVAPGPFQHALADVLDVLPDSYYRTLRTDLQRKRDLLSAGLEAAGLTVYRPRGAYFVTADIGARDGMAFCRELPAACGVVAIPSAVFYDDKAAGRSLVRFAFCKRDEVLTAAVDRLRSLRHRVRAGG